jgi:hypothetical protein
MLLLLCGVVHDDVTRLLHEIDLLGIRVQSHVWAKDYIYSGDLWVSDFFAKLENNDSDLDKILHICLDLQETKI